MKFKLLDALDKYFSRKINRNVQAIGTRSTPAP